MNTAPFALGDTITTDHTCAGEMCSTPMEVERITKMGGITADFRIGGTRCDGTPMDVLVWSDGSEAS